MRATISRGGRVATQELRDPLQEVTLAQPLGPDPFICTSTIYAVELELQAGSLAEDVPLHVTFVECRRDQCAMSIDGKALQRKAISMLGANRSTRVLSFPHTTGNLPILNPLSRPLRAAFSCVCVFLCRWLSIGKRARLGSMNLLDAIQNGMLLLLQPRGSEYRKITIKY